MGSIEKIKNIFKNKLILMCFGFALIYLISGYFAYAEILITLCACVLFAVLPIEESLCLLLFLHSFTQSNMAIQTHLTYTVVAFCIIWLIKYFIKVKKDNLKFNKFTFFSILIFSFIWSFISLFYKLDYHGFTYIFYLPIIFVLIALKDEISIKRVMAYLTFGLFLSVGLSVLCLILPKYQYLCTYGESRFCAFHNNPNYLYMKALFILAYYIYSVINKQINFWPFLLIYCSCAGITILTLSKTGILMLMLLSLIFVVLFLIKDFKQNIKYVGIMALIAIIFCAIMFKSLQAIVVRFLSDNTNMTELTTGRTDIWIDYLHETFSSPWSALFGEGLFAKEVFINAQQTTRASHNLFIFLLYRFGIIGCIAFGYIVYLLMAMFTKRKLHIENFIPLVFLILESCCDNTFKVHNFIYFALVILILFDNSLKTKTEIDKPTNNEIETKTATE